MRPIDDSSYHSSDDRRSEVAGIFAGGILRLHSRAAMAGNGSHRAIQESSEESDALRLEVPKETVLTVHTG